MDDLTVVNQIGTKRGDHKYTVTSEVMLSLPEHLRYSWQYVMLLSVVESHVQRMKGGMLWVLCGRDEFNVEVDSDSLAAEKVKLQKGVWIKVPDDNGTSRPTVSPSHCLATALTSALASPTAQPTAQPTSVAAAADPAQL